MEAEKVHDERADTSSEGVVLIVRQHNRYGAAHAGERVRVDASELSNRSTMEACMTLEAYEAHRAKQAAKKADPPKVSQLKATVDAELARIQEQALEKQRKREEAAKAAPPAIEPAALEKSKGGKKQPK